MIKKVLKVEDGGERIDKFLKEGFSQFSREFLKKLIIDGGVLVNGEKVKVGYKLKEGDHIFCEIEIPKEKKIEPQDILGIRKVFENKDVLVIEKPAGLIVHPSESQKENTLVNWLLHKYPEIKGVGEGEDRPGIVHRLDKETSGLLIVAKNQKSFEHLKRQFIDKEIKKEYVALVYGNLKDSQGVLIDKLKRSKKDPTKIVVSDEGRESQLSYETLERFENYTLLKVFPKTGRMHQIRVQFKNIGHPVLGDKKYGFRKMETPDHLKRHFLHAHKIVFKDSGGDRIEIKNDLPSDLQTVLDKLRKSRV